MYVPKHFEAPDVVQILVVQPLAQGEAAALDLAQVGDESRFRVDRSREHDARYERMAVQPVVGVAFGRAGKAVRRVEAEFLVDLH